MKKLFITFILLTTTICLKAQTITQDALPDLDKINIDGKIDSSKNVAIERIPEFPGGIEKFMVYVTKNFRMPENSGNSAGKVMVSFIVEKDGSITNTKVSRGLSTAINNEAIRVVSRSPKWLPGIQNGKTVRVAYSIPIIIN